MPKYNYFYDLSRKEPENPHHYVHLARLHIQDKNIDKAGDALRKAIEVNPGDSYAWNHLVYLIKMPKKGSIGILKNCFNDFNSFHPSPAEHNWHIIRREVALEDIEKFAEVGYMFFRGGQKYPFIKFLFDALSQIETKRKNVFLNLEWLYANENKLSIKAEIPHFKLNIFCCSVETLSDMAEKDLLVIGNPRQMEFMHDCKVYVSSQHKISLHHLNHMKGLFIRDGLRDYSKLSYCLPVKVGGSADLSSIRDCESSEFWFFGEATHPEAQGNNKVYIRKRRKSEGEHLWVEP